MSFFGKYIYGIIETKQDWHFGPIGIDGQEVRTVGFDDLAMVVSNFQHEQPKVTGSRKNMITHQRVIERLMEEFTVLPVSFGTLANRDDEVQNLLQRRYFDFKKSLKNLDNKIELGVKALWVDMKAVFENILEENQPIKDLKLQIDGTNDTNNLIRIGQMVEAALEAKKTEDSQAILEELKTSCLAFKISPNIAESMFLNASFLVSKGREKEFDNILDDLAAESEGKINFKYVGPLAPYNFVDIEIAPEEWELH